MQRRPPRRRSTPLRRRRATRRPGAPLLVLATALTALHATPGAARAAPASRTASRPASGPATRPKPVAKRRRAARAKPRKVVRFTLARLLERVGRTYPGVQAAQHALAAMERQLFRAKWAWTPAGKLRGLLAPTPKIECFDADGKRNAERCVWTTSPEINSFNIGGVMARFKVEFGMPVYTFGKLGAAKRAAKAGVASGRAKVTAARADVELNVIRAYWGLKLAQEILYTIRQGRKHLTKAHRYVEKALDEGSGEVTLQDSFRLKSASTEVDVRTLEARKLERIARASIATLAALGRRPFALDKAVIAVRPGTLDRLQRYLDRARTQRPELRMLAAAARAQNAAVDLERARFFPDFLLVGTFGYGWAPGVDNPENAFYSDPFNFFTAGFGLALNWKLDFVQQAGKYSAAKAKARRVTAKQREAALGIELEIKKLYIELKEAQGRLKATKKGFRVARSWLVATSQNLSAGLVKTRELTDALLPYFQMKLRYLQAIYDVNVGWARLARAVGDPLPR